MRLSDYLCPACTIADMAAKTKEEALLELAGSATRAHLDKDSILAVLLERERLGSTAVGNGIAIPHGKMSGQDTMTLAFARSLSGVAFDAPDGLPCRLFFMVLAPEGAAGQHLGLLGSIARLTKDSTVTARLLQANTAVDLNEFLGTL